MRRGIFRIKLDRTLKQLSRLHEARTIRAKYRLDCCQYRMVRRRHPSLAGTLVYRATLKQLGVDLRHGGRRDPVLQGKQAVQGPVELRRPDHLEVQHNVKQRHIYMHIVANDLHRAINDIIQLVGPAPGQRIANRSRAVPESRGRNQARSTETRQGRRNLLRHPKRQALRDLRAKAPERKDRHSPPELMARGIDHPCRIHTAPKNNKNSTSAHH